MSMSVCKMTGKMIFLTELQNKIRCSSWPLLIGRDFNLVRRVEDKSSRQVDIRFMNAFNDMIDVVSVIELYRNGSKYNWSNKQLDPVLSVLDSIFVTNS